MPAYLDFFLSPNEQWPDITSFKTCFQIDAAVNTPAPLVILQAICITIYTLSEIIYSIVICRLFIGNILRLTVYCDLLPPDPVKFISFNHRFKMNIQK